MKTLYETPKTVAEIAAVYLSLTPMLDHTTKPRLKFWIDRFGDKNLAELSPDDVDAALMRGEVSIMSDSRTGLVAARDVCLQIETMNMQATRCGKTPNLKGMVGLMKTEIAKGGEHADMFLLAMAEFVSAALDGVVIIPSTWKPLE